MVETNFLTALAYGERGRGCEVVQAASEAGLVRLMVPAASIAEVIKSWESRRRDWNGMHGKLREAQRTVERSARLSEFAGQLGIGRVALLQMVDRAERSIWERLLEVVPTFAQIATDAAVLATARDNLEFLEGLSPADALVVAAVTVAAGRGQARAFLTLDAKLAERTAGFFADRGIELFTDGLAALRKLDIDPVPLVSRMELEA